MKNNFNYIRYVDDIRIFCKSPLEAQKAAVKLEVLCRNLGLIPQGKKFAISEIEKLNDALFDMFPSIPSEEPTEDEIDNLTRKEAERIFNSAVRGRPLKIIDKSKSRFARKYFPNLITISHNSLKSMAKPIVFFHYLY